MVHTSTARAQDASEAPPAAEAAEPAEDESAAEDAAEETASETEVEPADPVEETDAPEAPAIPPAPAAAAAPPEAGPSPAVEAAGVGSPRQTAQAATPKAADEGAADEQPAAEAEAKGGKKGGGTVSAECEELVESGQISAALARGCPNAGSLPWAGSSLSLSPTVAPFMRTTPQSDNAFFAGTLTLLPRWQFTPSFGLRASWSLLYEFTESDGAESERPLSTDIILSAPYQTMGAGAIGYIVGPRIVLPASKAAINSKAVMGLGAQGTVFHVFPELANLQVALTGRYTYNATRNGQTQQANEDPIQQDELDGRVVTRTLDPVDFSSSDPCTNGEGAALPCPASNLATSVNSVLLNLGTAMQLGQWNISASYLYIINQPRELPETPNPGVTREEGQNVEKLDDHEWRRIGQFSMGVGYQPSGQYSVGMTVASPVCYGIGSGFESALGGCAGGLKNDGENFFNYNPILNRFSTISLSFNWFIDQTYLKLRN